MTASLSAPDEQYEDGPHNGPVPVDAAPGTDREERALQVVPPPPTDVGDAGDADPEPMPPSQRKTSGTAAKSGAASPMSKANKPAAKRTATGSGTKTASKATRSTTKTGSSGTKSRAAKSPRTSAKKPTDAAAAARRESSAPSEGTDAPPQIVDAAGGVIVVPPKPPLPPEFAAAAPAGETESVPAGDTDAEASGAEPAVQQESAAVLPTIFRPPPRFPARPPAPAVPASDQDAAAADAVATTPSDAAATVPDTMAETDETAEADETAETDETDEAGESTPAGALDEPIEAPEPPSLDGIASSAFARIGSAPASDPSVDSDPAADDTSASDSATTVVPDEVDAAATDDTDAAVLATEAEATKPFHKPSKHPEIDPDAPALSLRGVVKAFGGTRAVDGIDLTVPAGTFYGLVGPNGAGKTTTLSMIAGLLRPDRGSIEVCGVDAAAAPRVAKRMMGVLPDRLRTFDRLTGRQLLYYYGTLRGLRPAVVESRTADLARAFDLRDALSRVVSDYSAGMTKKVMLAGAMIHSPRLLVLDEPFEAVDPASSATILEILGTYVSHGGTVILSSHGMELIEQVCSRVAVLVAGQALAEGTVEEVRGELTLEQRFVELAGGLSDVEGLEWLHTFSD